MTDSVDMRSIISEILRNGKIDGFIPMDEIKRVQSDYDLSNEKVEEICAQVSAEGEVCVAANFNCPGQIVISGSIEGINKACELMKAAGAKRALSWKQQSMQLNSTLRNARFIRT